MKFTTLHTFDTEYSADSIEWCPYAGHRTHFVCGTYQLEEHDGGAATTTSTDASLQRRRKGCIYLFEYIEASNELVQLQRLNTAAILDMKWRPPPNDASVPILATANAIGLVEVYELVANELVSRKNYQLCADGAENVLALSLDWHSNGQLLVSDSKGGITLLAYTDAGELIRLQSWSAHSFEAWICAFDKWHSSQVYSGGDDCLLRAYDLRANKHVWSNKEHMAGVTCLLSHPRREHILLTGSYDEQLRMFDTRNHKYPLTSIALNGGIWRIKTHPIRDQFLLVACMYENFSVVHMDNLAGDAQLTLAGVYKEHSSICYGADWCQTNTRLAENISYMATCSFYDHKLCVTQLDY